MCPLLALLDIIVVIFNNTNEKEQGDAFYFPKYHKYTNLL
jgi:hypothetical protein